MNDTRLNTAFNLQRKSAIAQGGAFDLAGQVEIVRMKNLEMERTIFVGKEAVWPQSAATAVESEYSKTFSAAPPIDQRLVDFMQNECDFSMEHADGSFLEHLVFCHDSAAQYYPEHSANVALLHSILGTATNTFAMDARKLPELNYLLADFEAEQVGLFPSTLRLFYNGDFLSELENNMHRLDKLAALHVNRVIDNQPMSVSAESLWINLNYHLMHFVALFGRVSGLLPASVTLRLAKKSIREYSRCAGHDLNYRLEWSR